MSGWVLRRIKREGGLLAALSDSEETITLTQLFGAGIFAATAVARQLFADGFVLDNLLGADIRNETGGDLNPGTLVVVSGYSATHHLPLVVKADADAISGRVPAYVIREVIVNGANGLGYKTWRSTATFNTTTAANVGDPVYAHTTPGSYTMTRPSQAVASPRIVGRVETKAITGIIDFNLLREDPAGVGTNDLQASAVTSDKMDETVIRYRKVTLTDAQVKLLAGAPIEIIPAPGAGKKIVPMGGDAVFDFTAAYAEPSAPDDLVLRYENGAGAIITEDIDVTGFLTAAADTTTNIRPKKDVIVAKTGCENKAVVLHNTGTDYTGGNAANEVDIHVWYAIIPTGL